MARAAALAVLLALAPLLPAASQAAPARHDPHESVPLSTNAIAGQKIPVLPLASLVADAGLPAEEGAADPWRDRSLGVRRADSLLSTALRDRAPEVTWLSPGQVRRIAARAGGILNDPDQMGQALLRAPELKHVPDPLRSQLRTLAAMAGGRYVLVPAALAFTVDPAGIKAAFSLVIADPRTGDILWRTIATGRSRTTEGAFRGALETLFP